MNFRRQRDDPARCVFRHFFLHRDGHAAKIDAEFFRLYSHGRANAGAESSRDQVGG